MAMYMFQELSPKIFYFTYCLQEPEKYIDFIEESEFMDSSHLVSKWKEIRSPENQALYGHEKILSSNFKEEDLPVDGRSLYLINSLKSTFLYCFGQYRLFNNIQDEINLSSNFVVKKYEEKFLHNELGSGKYTAYMYINDDYQGGTITFKGTKAFVKPEKASIIIAPSEMMVTSSPSLDSIRYVAIGEWI